MKILTKTYSLAVVLFFCSFAISAQSYELGVFGGVTTYQGDLSDGVIVWPAVQPAGGLLFRYTPLSFVAVKFGVTAGKLLGDDKNSKDPALRSRGYSFYSAVKELSVTGELQLPYYGLSSYGMFKMKVTPFVFGGVALTVINGEPKAPADKVPYPFPEFNAKKNFFVIPVGGGFKFQFVEKVALSLEWGMRKTFSDYIDGISVTGNPRNNDWYIFGGMTLTYKVDGGEFNPYKGRNRNGKR